MSLGGSGVSIGGVGSLRDLYMYHGNPRGPFIFRGYLFHPYFEGLETFMVSHGFLGSYTV